MPVLEALQVLRYYQADLIECLRGSRKGTEQAMNEHRRCAIPEAGDDFAGAIAQFL
jgi:hypothetical protein